MADWGEPEIADLRKDIGDDNNRFTREELVRLLNRADRLAPNASPDQVVDIACAIGIDQLVNSAARFNDFVINEEQQKRSDIHRQLMSTLKAKQARGHVREALNLDGGDFDAVVVVPITYQRTRAKAPEGEYPTTNFARRRRW